MYHAITSMFRRFKHSEDGIAFVEFALVMPFLLVLLLGCVEITRYIIINQKVEKAAMIIADLTSQGTTITNSDLNNIVTAATQVMQPFGFTADGYVIVSSVTQTGAYSISNPPKVNWQYTSSGSAGTWTHASHIGSVGLVATLPNSMTLNDKDNIIIAEVFFNFHPILSGNGILSTTEVYKIGLYKPRLGTLGVLSALPFRDFTSWRIV